MQVETWLPDYCLSGYERIAHIPTITLLKTLGSKRLQTDPFFKDLILFFKTA